MSVSETGLASVMSASARIAQVAVPNATKGRLERAVARQLQRVVWPQAYGYQTPGNRRQRTLT